MLGEATLDVSGTFAGEAIRVLILFAAQQRRIGFDPSRPLGLRTGNGSSCPTAVIHQSADSCTKPRCEP
jgi:hypothetical protein